MKEERNHYDVLFCAPFVVLFFACYLLINSSSTCFDYLVYNANLRTYFQHVISSLSTQLCHLSIAHLLVNAAFLVFAFSLLKERKKILVLCLIGIMTVAAALLLFSQPKIYVGASGWLGTVLGSALISSLRDNKYRICAQNIELICISFTYIILPFIVPNVSALMHISGFTAGVITELVCSVYKRRTNNPAKT
jgi:membrane associated rhomboid family serine protease